MIQRKFHQKKSVGLRKLYIKINTESDNEARKKFWGALIQFANLSTTDDHTFDLWIIILENSS